MLCSHRAHASICDEKCRNGPGWPSGVGLAMAVRKRGRAGPPPRFLRQATQYPRFDESQVEVLLSIALIVETYIVLIVVAAFFFRSHLSFIIIYMTIYLGCLLIERISCLSKTTPDIEKRHRIRDIYLSLISNKQHVSLLASPPLSSSFFFRPISQSAATIHHLVLFKKTQQHDKRPLLNPKNQTHKKDQKGQKGQNIKTATRKIGRVPSQSIY